MRTREVDEDTGSDEKHQADQQELCKAIGVAVRDGDRADKLTDG